MIIPRMHDAIRRAFHPPPAERIDSEGAHEGQSQAGQDDGRRVGVRDRRDPATASDRVGGASEPDRGDHADQLLEQARRQADAAWATFWIALGALVVSIVGSGFVWITYRATRQEVEQARRQAIAAEQGLPRAWLYVDVPRPLHVLVDTVGQSNGKRRFSITVPFSLVNYGQLPATIIQVDARMYVAASDEPAPGYPLDIYHRLRPSFRMSGSVQPAWGRYDGQVIALAQPLALGQAFAFSEQPILRSVPEALDRWIYVLVRYKDPLGGGRVTSFLGKVGDASVTDTDDQRYNYQR